MLKQVQNCSDLSEIVHIVYLLKKIVFIFRQQQEVLNSESGEPLSLMYSQLLHNYENVKDDYTLVRKRHDDLVASHSDAVSKLEHSQVS